MKRFFIATTLLLLSAATIAAQPRKTCIDHDWRFRYGAAADAHLAEYDDASWRSLNLPHDWSVETEAATALGDNVGPFSRKSIGTDATGWTVGGEGWYRKHFTLDKADLNHRLLLYFEGIYNHSEVWLNGQQIATCNYGYRPFRVDITPYCRPAGEDNVLAIRVRNEGKNTRWYAGSGIYRHVWLMRTPHLYMDEWETDIHVVDSALTADSPTCRLQASTLLHNDGDRKERRVLEVTVYAPDHRIVATHTERVTMQPHTQQSIAVHLDVAQPQLWAPAHPHRYTATLRLSDGKTDKGDCLDIPFGIRTLQFSATKGFLLNGEPTLLHGGCVHHDNGLLGAAAFDRAETRKLTLLKQNGFNAVRCSHNLPSEHFLDVCDSIGLMVIDECFDQWLVAKNPDDYHNYFAAESNHDVQTMVRRDRRHPSIIMWSIGNEIPGRIEPDGIAAAERLRQQVRTLDTTRPVTAAICDWDQPSHPWRDERDNAFRSLDVGGYNYLYQHYEPDHERHPDRIMYGAESYPKRASENWALVERHPYVIGDFVWTAMDYLGEAGIGSAQFVENGKNGTFFQPWPWMNGWCGDIDLIGEKKPQSYYRDIVWNRRPIAMAVEEPCPQDHYQAISQWGWQREHLSWTFPDVAEGTPLRVNVYAKQRVRLLLNGDPIGEKQPDATFCAAFDVPYHPGTLTAELVDVPRSDSTCIRLQTTGTPVAIRLRTDRTTIDADGTDLAYIIAELIDADGNVVTSDSQRIVHFTTDGDGILLAGGNASPTDMASFRSATPHLFEGRALAILQSKRLDGTGIIRLTVSSDGLPDATISIATEHR